MHGPYWLGRAHRRAKKPLHGRPALHFGLGSATNLASNANR
eukprot:COSAG02_NODE_26822_length_623_cov_1.517176_1_plen_40_part_10